jgi:hypothetical protein
MNTQYNILKHAISLLDTFEDQTIEVYINNTYFNTIDKNTNTNVLAIPKGVISFDYADNGIYRYGREIKH